MLPNPVHVAYVFEMTPLATFGSPHVTLPTRTLGPGKAVALLAYLSAAPGRSAYRKDLFRLLYSEDTPRDADAFRQLLASLRKLLPGVFVTTGDLLSLTEELDSDRRQFLDAVNRGDDEASVTRYTREFFEDFAERGCDAFMRWAAEERSRLRKRFELSAETVVRSHLLRADWTAALAVAWSIAERFPNLAVSTRLVVETLTIAGRGAEIRQTLSEVVVNRNNGTPAHARQLDRLLEDVERLARDGGLADPTGPLIGRQREFRTLIETWTAVRSASGGALLIDAPAGFGKSRLLANMSLRLRLDTPSVIRLTAHTTNDASPLALIHRLATAVIALTGALGASPPSYATLRGLSAGASNVAGEDTPALIARITEAVVDGLRAAGEEAPVALLLDDVHLADGAVIHIIAGAIARLHNSRVLFVIAARESLADRITVPARHRLTLGPLDATDVGYLCTAAGVTDTTDAVHALHEATDGVPFRVVAQIAKPSVTLPTNGPRTTTTPAAIPAIATPTVVRRARRWRVVPLLLASAAVVVFAARATRRDELTTNRRAETLVVETFSGDSLRTDAIRFSAPDAPSAEPATRVLVGRTAHWPLGRTPERIAISPDGETMAAQFETDGENTMDIVGVRGDRTFPIATGKRDDGAPSWSPDGSMVAFNTTRWSPTGNEGCNIAVRDMRTRDIWRVTEGPDCDFKPAWSQSGTSLAFVRRSSERGDRTSVCTIAEFASPPRCVAIDTALMVHELLGWTGPTTVLISSRGNRSSGLYQFNISNGAVQPIRDGLTLVEASLSPSGAYVACWCSENTSQANHITVIDLSGRRPVIELPAAASSPFRQLAWFSPGTTTGVNHESIRNALSARDRTVASEARFRLAHRDASEPQSHRDTLLGSNRRATSPAIPYTDVGATLALSHVTQNDHLALDERWNRIDGARWVSFGEPRPRAGTTLGGLDPAGDGSYPSGLYTRESFDGDSGITVEAIVRVPVTRPAWQEIGIYLESDEFVRSIAGWNHRTGVWSSSNPNLFFEIGIKYPALEGRGREERIFLASRAVGLTIPVSASLGDGHDVLLTISLRRDSTVAYAANGRQLGRLRYTPPPSGRYHLFIMGHSVESDIRVRAVRVWARESKPSELAALSVGVGR